MTAAGWCRMLPGLALDVDAGALAALPPYELAARALYGQPFEFTRAYLGALRMLTISAGDADYLALGDTLPEIGQAYPTAVAEAVELAAALLPPDDA